MCLTYLIIPCSGIYLYGNTITSFAGTTFDCKYCEWVPLPHRVPNSRPSYVVAVHPSIMRVLCQRFCRSCIDMPDAASQ